MITLGGRIAARRLPLAAGLVAAGLVPAAVVASAAPAAPRAVAPAAAPAPLVIGVDLPFQGMWKDTSTETWAALNLYADRVGHRAGARTFTLKRYDNSTAAAGMWTAARCQANARAHAANAAEVAVVGPMNSGCAKVEVPILATAAGGPVLMVTHAGTNPGLTKPWLPGEPGVYRPGGVRTFARVVPTDERQGTAAVGFAGSRLKAKRCAVLDDGEVYGKGVAKAFVAGAKAARVRIVYRGSWSGRSSTYTALMRKVKAAKPTCLYLAGIYDNNGARLLRDKVAVLGTNSKVKVIAPDGFTGWPTLNASKEGAGLYATYAGMGLEGIAAQRSKAVTAFLNAFARSARHPVRSSYTLYAVTALQTVLAAVAASDGTRAGVHGAVFAGRGVTVPAATSLIGRAVSVDPATGDVRQSQVTVEQIVAKQERYFTTRYI